MSVVGHPKMVFLFRYSRWPGKCPQLQDELFLTPSQRGRLYKGEAAGGAVGVSSSIDKYCRLCSQDWTNDLNRACERRRSRRRLITCHYVHCITSLARLPRPLRKDGPGWGLKNRKTMKNNRKKKNKKILVLFNARILVIKKWHLCERCVGDI